MIGGLSFLLGCLVVQSYSFFSKSKCWLIHSKIVNDFGARVALWEADHNQLPSLAVINDWNEYKNFRTHVVYLDPNENKDTEIDSKHFIAWGTQLSPFSGERHIIFSNRSVGLVEDGEIDWARRMIIRRKRER